MIPSLKSICLQNFYKNPDFFISSLLLPRECKNSLDVILQCLQICNLNLRDYIFSKAISARDIPIIEACLSDPDFIIFDTFIIRNMLAESDLEMIELFLKYRKDFFNNILIGTKTFKNRMVYLTPFAAAVKDGNISLIQLLASYDQDVDFKTHEKAFPYCMMSALFRFRIDIVRILLNNGATVTREMIQHFKDESRNFRTKNPAKDKKKILIRMLEQNLSS